MSNLTSTEKEVINKFDKWCYENNPSNDFYVQITERARSFLGIQEISDHSEEHKINKNTAKEFKNVLEIFNVKLTK